MVEERPSRAGLGLYVFIKKVVLYFKLFIMVIILIVDLIWIMKLLYAVHFCPPYSKEWVPNTAEARMIQ